MTDRNNFLWPKPNRNRISASIPVSAETETLDKFKFIFYAILTNYKLEKHT